MGLSIYHYPHNQRDPTNYMKGFVMKKLFASIIAIIFAISLSACSSTTPPASSTPSKASQAITSAPEVHKVLTATEVTTALTRAISTVKMTAAYTDATDPNTLMGRPNQYTSNTAFSDSRVPSDKVSYTKADSTERGGGVEIFANEADAMTRSAYIQSVLKAGGAMFGTEYHFQNGGILVRVTGNLTPAQSADYKAAVASLKP